MEISLFKPVIAGAENNSAAHLRVDDFEENFQISQSNHQLIISNSNLNIPIRQRPISMASYPFRRDIVE